VDNTGDAFAVTVDGHLYRVDAARLDAQTLSLIVDSAVPEERRAVYEAIVVPESDSGRLVVRVGGAFVTLARGRDRLTRRVDSRPGSGPLRISAPMPGKVVRVLVERGQSVRARQPIVVVEAMKMENALRTDRDGTVAEVLVDQGASVEAGALLVVIQ
jgi:biotin carboxyl carrier protein